ncbi:MAG: thiolase family protein [Chloroflexota bacterium]|nr:MAG: thiolase family protein [Chloroflexota bacterium]
MDLSDVVVLGGARTPFGKFGGGLVGFASWELGGFILPKALEKVGISRDLVDMVLMGHNRQSGSNPARVACILAGLEHVPAVSLNSACSVGAVATIFASRAIRCGDAEVVVVGGMDSMSNIPHVLKGTRWQGTGYGNLTVMDGWYDVGDIPDLDAGIHPSEFIAKRYGLTRRDLDEFALDSHQKAARAWDNGWYDDEVVPVPIPANGQQPASVCAIDEHFRRGTSVEQMMKVPPAFLHDGTGVTSATNSSGIVDGACAIVLASRRKALELGIKPRSSLVSWAITAEPHLEMFEGPAVAIPVALQRAGMTLDDMDFIEVNEAFGSQIVSNERRLKWDHAKLNPGGGAIAIGHPTSTSGSRLVLTMTGHLQRQDKEYGVIAICGGGAVTGSLVLKRES